MTPTPRWQQTITTTALCSLAFAAPLAIWYLATGNPIQYFTQEVPPGQLPYIFSKLAGLLAFSCFWLQCLLALARRAPVLQNNIPPLSTRAHIRLGLTTVGLITAHLGLFFAAVTLRTGKPAWGLLLPHFNGGFYQLHVGLGLIGLWLLLLAVFAGWQVHRGKQAWKKVHMAWFAVFALVFWHAFTIGSESRYGIMRYVFLLMSTSLAAVVLSRLGFAWQRKKEAVLASQS
ncbi:hypothetical protein [Microbulbifer litoralis]|uniref:hypothetical protein n=1 Tax=Microbulbifer litoralis TaxID=2933965 RepID=UPI0020277B0F|nr:hypothetical protein [Microbulbifer sp. GX H0434]